MDSVIILGAGLPGMAAVEMTASALARCSASLSACCCFSSSVSSVFFFFLA